MTTQLDFTYYRTIDKSEINLVVEGNFGVITVEIKRNSIVKRKSLRGLQNFLDDMKADYGFVINTGKHIEFS